MVNLAGAFPRIVIWKYNLVYAAACLCIGRSYDVNLSPHPLPLLLYAKNAIPLADCNTYKAATGMCVKVP